MDFKISSIKIECNNKKTILIPFSSGITFFYGNTGVGKTTLFNLINYALGQDLLHTQIVDDEVKNVSLDTLICGKRLSIRRKVSSNLIEVKDDKDYVFLAKGDSGNRDTFSDYLYKLAGIEPMEMLRGRSSNTVKISFANFMWYSYLRQDELDNTLFYLDEKNGNYKQYASNYVLRTILDESKTIKKEILQQIRRITEKQENIQNRLSVIREIFSLSKLFKVNIGNEIAKKYQMLEKMKEEVNLIFHARGMIDENRNRELIIKSRMMGKYEAEIQYLQEFNKVKSLHRKYERLQKEYEQEKQNCICHMENIGNESFTNNVNYLEQLFRDSLLGVGFPNFSEKDIVKIDTSSFGPRVYSEIGEFQFDYYTLSSSGIRTIFKICYVLSIHRFVKETEVETLLPTLIMIDTPMKNISERMDEDLHTKLYHYFYEVFSESGALYGTQLIIIDKEMSEIFECKGISCRMFTKESPLIPLL